MTSKQQILAQVEQAFRVTDDQLNDLVLGFNEEMKAGLDNTNRATKSSELKMIPSYVTGKLRFLQLITIETHISFYRLS
jgi:hexokinase